MSTSFVVNRESWNMAITIAITTTFMTLISPLYFAFCSWFTHTNICCMHVITSIKIILNVIFKRAELILHDHQSLQYFLLNFSLNPLRSLCIVYTLCERVYWLLVAGVGEENPPGRDLTQVHPVTACWHAGHCWTYYSQRKYYWVDISSAVLNKHVHIIEGEYLETRKFVFEHSQRLETKIFLLSVLELAQCIRLL